MLVKSTPGTRVICPFFDYSTTRVIGSSIKYLQFGQKLSILNFYMKLTKYLKKLISTWMISTHYTVLGLKGPCS